MEKVKDVLGLARDWTVWLWQAGAAIIEHFPNATLAGILIAVALSWVF